MLRTSPRPASERHSVSAQLAHVIESRGLTAYAVGKAAAVNNTIIHRFLKGERGLSLEVLDKVALALGLRLVEVATRKAPARGRGRAPAAIPADGPTAELGSIAPPAEG